MEINNKFDNQFKNIEHYKIHPQMLPFVGSEYENKKILIVTESHYVPNGEQPNDEWYTKPANENVRKNTNSRDIICKDQKDRIFINIMKALNEHDNTIELKSISWYNYFQKPAQPIKTIQATKLDKEISANVFYNILEILKPNIVIIASKKSYFSAKDDTRFNDYSSIVKSTAHPSSRFWFSKVKSYRGKSGRDVFIEHLEKFKHKKSKRA